MTERIYEFRNDYAFLSNFSWDSVVLDGIRYRSAEHAYQAQKAVYSRDLRAIMDCKTPGQAKRMGRKIEMVLDFEKNKLDIMYRVVHQKFFDNDLLAWDLKRTGDAQLIEGNTWHDNIWGNCYCANCKNIEGQNLLGKLLMEIREEIQNV